MAVPAGKNTVADRLQDIVFGIIVLVIVSIKYIFFISIFVLIICALIYDYEDFNGVTDYCAKAMAGLYFIAFLGFPIFLFAKITGESWRDSLAILAGTIALLTIISVVSSLALFLAHIWRIALSSDTVSNLSVPAAMSRKAVGLLQSAGDLFDKPQAHQPTHTVPPPPAPSEESRSFWGGVWIWVRDSVWNVILGVAATFIAAWISSRWKGLRNPAGKRGAD